MTVSYFALLTMFHTIFLQLSTHQQCWWHIEEDCFAKALKQSNGIVPTVTRALREADELFVFRDNRVHKREQAWTVWQAHTITRYFIRFFCVPKTSCFYYATFTVFSKYWLLLFFITYLLSVLLFHHKTKQKCDSAYLVCVELRVSLNQSAMVWQRVLVQREHWTSMLVCALNYS